MSAWVFDLAAWIIQDGNYADFQRGQVAEFAVEFEFEAFQTVEAATPSARLLRDGDYAISGEVVFTDGDVWVIDCGILIYNELRPSRVRDRHGVTGTALLGIDPFPYFERLNRLPRMPALVYTWEIVRIRRLTAPSVAVDVDATDAWRDDDGTADYLLDCVRLDVPAKHDSSTAIP
jgi:hypothetical protein